MLESGNPAIFTQGVSRNFIASLYYFSHVLREYKNLYQGWVLDKHSWAYHCSKAQCEKTTNVGMPGGFSMSDSEETVLFITRTAHCFLHRPFVLLDSCRGLGIELRPDFQYLLFLLVLMFRFYSSIHYTFTSRIVHMRLFGWDMWKFCI